LEILSAATGTPPQTLAATYSQYGPLKADTGAAVIEMIAPIRARYVELMADPSELSRLISIGDTRAREAASATLARAHSAIGLLPR
jgi:tryptophanyl-tRNA synthetase